MRSKISIQQYSVLVLLCPVSVARLWFIQVKAKFLVLHSCESQAYNTMYDGIVGLCCLHSALAGFVLNPDQQ